MLSLSSVERRASRWPPSAGWLCRWWRPSCGGWLRSSGCGRCGCLRACCGSRRSAQNPRDVLRLVGHLDVGEAQRSEAGRDVGLVTPPVARLLRRGAVIAQAVGLDDQAQVGPVEVDAEAVHSCLRLRLWQARALDNREEAPLEGGLRQRETAAIEEAFDRRGAPAAVHLLDRLAQSLRIDQVEPIRL